MNDSIGHKHRPLDRHTEEIGFKGAKVSYSNNGTTHGIPRDTDDKSTISVGTLPKMQQANMDDGLSLDGLRAANRILQGLRDPHEVAVHSR